MSIGYLRIIGHLTLSCLPSELKHIFIYLSEARGAYWFAIRKASPVSVNRQSSIYLGITVSEHFLLFSMFAKTVFCHVHDFCT